jgi:Holliday junction resolvase RusA-like endonuclease
MARITADIPGITYARNKSCGNLDAPKKWTEAVKEHTAKLPKITEACMLRITYMLPRSHVPSNYPFGTDLDNLNKRLLDGLNHTVFSEARGKDSCVAAMEAMKVIVEAGEETGAHIEIFPIKLP